MWFVTPYFDKILKHNFANSNGCNYGVWLQVDAGSGRSGDGRDLLIRWPCFHLHQLPDHLRFLDGRPHSTRFGMREIRDCIWINFVLSTPSSAWSTIKLETSFRASVKKTQGDRRRWYNNGSGSHNRDSIDVSVNFLPHDSPSPLISYWASSLLG